MAECINEEDDLLLDLRFKLETHEIRTCLKLDEQQNGKAKKYIQSVILLIMTMFFLTSFFMDNMKTTSSLNLGIASLIVLIAVWVMPKWHISRQARLSAAEGVNIYFKLYQDKIVIGKSNPVSLTFDKFNSTLINDILVLEFKGKLICIPRRAAGDKGFSILLQKCGLNNCLNERGIEHGSDT